MMSILNKEIVNVRIHDENLMLKTFVYKTKGEPPKPIV